MRAIAVFCGSQNGARADYFEAARKLGFLFAKHQVTLVYGGASVGLMGILANSVLEKGGAVIGVIPKDLMNRELAHSNLTELRVVESMHERKALMERLSSGFIAMPGGFGTLDELCEILTWNQLGYHDKPCGFLNVSGYFDKFFEFIQGGVQERFIRSEHFSRLLVASEPEDLMQKFL